MATLGLDSPDDHLRSRDVGNAPPREPLTFQILNLLLRGVSPFRRPLSTRELLNAAQRRTGLADFGEWDIEEPLSVLIKSYEQEARLSSFGRMAARWDLLRFLSNLLYLREEERKSPAIVDEKIERPIFITGLPRSGTSFLHELLCEDTGNLAVRCWEAIYPCPLDPSRPVERDIERRRKKVDRQLASFERIAPEIRSLHPMVADTPQECTEITGHVFLGMRFDTTHHIPTYRRWLDGRSLTPAYRFHKRFLQHLQHRRGRGQWILKCPDHVFALDAVREVYPDARFVFMHRDPLAVLPSVARLTETLRRPFTARLDRLEIGAEVSERWAKGAKILLAAAPSFAAGSAPAFHLPFRRFVRDPAAAVEAVYAHFGIPLGAETAARVRGLVATRPNGGNGRNLGRLEDYGLDADRERARFAEYVEFFGLVA
ncbi:MAG TPA: sulfotransferase [Stellaceae bacterium]|nr:sulfotransferase [Stellaceae bacterium]